VTRLLSPAPPPGGTGLIAGYIACWRPSSVSGEAARFARHAAGAAAPATRARANALLWAAARLAAFGIPLGLEPTPEVLLHPSVIERFAASAPGLSGSARRTLRTNLRFLARRVVPALAPADAALPRERARRPTARRRSAAISRWLTPSRRCRGGCARPGWSAWAPAPA
jgi:hypothetical protein